MGKRIDLSEESLAEAIEYIRKFKESFLSLEDSERKVADNFYIVTSNGYTHCLNKEEMDEWRRVLNSTFEKY